MFVLSSVSETSVWASRWFLSSVIIFPETMNKRSESHNAESGIGVAEGASGWLALIIENGCSSFGCRGWWDVVLTIESPQKVTTWEIIIRLNYYLNLCFFVINTSNQSSVCEQLLHFPPSHLWILTLLVMSKIFITNPVTLRRWLGANDVPTEWEVIIIVYISIFI